MAKMEKRPPSKPADLAIRLLEQIRDQVTSTNTRLDDLTNRFDHLSGRVDRLDMTMQELAEQQRFIVRGMRALTERDRRFEKELATLRASLPT